MPFITSIERPDDEGRTLKDSATVTHTGADTEALTDAAIAENRTFAKCFGSDVYCAVATPTSGNVVDVQLAFYDEDDNLIDVSPVTKLTSGGAVASVKNDSGTANNRYVSDVLIWPANRAFKVVPYIVAMTTSEAVDVFVWPQSEDANA